MSSLQKNAFEAAAVAVGAAVAAAVTAAVEHRPHPFPLKSCWTNDIKHFFVTFE
jgi:hypothetical protein